jgi:uncharacterized protein involved in oxidation of intracellular sulfur
MDQIMVIINAAGYGNENAYDALRLSRALLDESEITVKVFLLGDAVICAKEGQKTPNGYYNLSKMIDSLIQKKVEIHVCGTCIEARGISEKELVNGVQKGTMKELSHWVHESDKVLTF